jgi:pilus assembly protein Flp/PilA
MIEYLRAIWQLKRDERGVTMLEYGLIAAVVAVVAVVGFSSLGNSLSGQMNNIANCVSAPTTTTCG